MRKLLLCLLLVLLIPCAAPAATVTYRMSYHDNGTGVFSANNWALYASASADSRGLAAFSVDLLPFSSGVFLNRANGVIMEDSNTGEQLNLGFTSGRLQDAAGGRISGMADLSAGTALRPVYGMGEQPGDLDNYIPPNFDTQLSVFGAGRQSYGVETYQGQNHFLLARGTWSGSSLPNFDVTSGNNQACVWTLNGTGREIEAATVLVAYRNPVIPVIDEQFLSAMTMETSALGAAAVCGVPEPGVSAVLAGVAAFAARGRRRGRRI